MELVDLTVIILTQNEENNLPKAVESVRHIAKRIVIVDSYSTDNTGDIARNFGCDVYRNKFTNHAEQFNWGLDNCGIETEWVLRLDADEQVTPDLRNELERILPDLADAISGLSIRRRMYFMGRWMKHGGVYPNLVLRIFRYNKGRCEEKIMDEHIVVDGQAYEIPFDIIDDNTKSLTWWTNKHNWYSDRECYEVLNLERLKSEGKLLNPSLFGGFTEKKRWLKENVYLKLPLGSRAWAYYIYRYYIKLGFLDGPEGRIFHFLQAYWYRFLVDAKIYEARKADGCTIDRISKPLE